MVGYRLLSEAGSLLSTGPHEANLRPSAIVSRATAANSVSQRRRAAGLSGAVGAARARHASRSRAVRSARYGELVVAVPSTYFVSTKNLEAILEQIGRGQVPSRFTFEHLKQLGYGSSNDRPIIPVLKALGFLDSNGVPTDQYRRLKDPNDAPFAIAEGVREAYSDVFAVDERADKLSLDKLKGIFARLSDKNQLVTDRMATTFRALADEGNFERAAAGGDGPGDDDDDDGGGDDRGGGDGDGSDGAGGLGGGGGIITLRHDVHVHLPATEDIKVYDAIFRSLRDTLLS